MRTIRPKILEIPGANWTFQLNRKRPIVYHHFTPGQGSLVLHRRKTLSLKEGNFLQTQLKFLLDYKTVHFFGIQVKLWLHAIATAMSGHACLALSSLASRLLSLSLKKAKKNNACYAKTSMRKKRLFCSLSSCIVVRTDESGNFQKRCMYLTRNKNIFNLLPPSLFWSWRLVA